MIHRSQVFLLLLVVSLAPAAGAQTVTVGAKQTVMKPDKRSHSLGKYFPDSSMHAFLLGEINYVFGANGDPQNTEGFKSAVLKKFANKRSLIKTTTNIPHGAEGAFDHNYSGGSAVYYDSGTGILLHLYHGEYWYTDTYTPFYAGLGLAYSTDLGATWHKLGQVISPQTARTGNCQVDVGGGTLLPVNGYFYTYYADEGAGCDGSTFETALARAKISDVIAAAQAGTPFTSGPGTLWKKYYNGGFTENGVTDLANPAAGGGAFTHLFTTGNNAWWHTVAYDSAISQYVMAYVAGWSGIAIRFSSDGITWSDATQVVNGTDISGGNAAFYPTLLNISGGDPETLGSSFYLYYVSPFGDWSRSKLERVQITVAPANAPASPTITQNTAGSR